VSSATGGQRSPHPSAHLSIDSVPSGAVVHGPAGEWLGTTPLKIEWPISEQPVTFELALRGYEKKQDQEVVRGNTALHIELERAVRRGGAGAADRANHRGD
jgi:hypothetical protein